MPLRVYLPTLFENTAEREIFDKIVKILTHGYDNNEESPVLIGNFSCMGIQYLLKDMRLIINHPK